MEKGNGLDGITFEGIPMGVVVEQYERNLAEREFKDEAGKFRGSIRKGGKVKMQTELRGVVHDGRRITREEDQFGLLVEKGGAITLGQWLKLPNDTKTKIVRLHKLLKMLPDRALSNEIAEMIQKELGVTDYQRLLMMLFQGGYLTREKDIGHRIIHEKTALAKSLDDARLASDMFMKNQVMVGFPVKTRPRKTMPIIQPPDPEELKAKEAQETQVAQGKQREPRYVEILPSAGNQPQTPTQAPTLSLSSREDPPPRNDPPFRNAPLDLREAMDLRLEEALQELDEADLLMVTELVRSLRVSRAFMPRLNRKKFLQTFIEGGRYVED